MKKEGRNYLDMWECDLKKERGTVSRMKTSARWL